LVFSGVTKSLLYELKMSGSADSACFSSDNRYLLTSGEECEIYQWDLNTRKLLHRTQDVGCLKNTTLSMTNDQSLIATGCTSGVVNVYRTQEPNHTLPSDTRPIKVTIPNTTLEHNELNYINNEYED